MTTQPLRPCVAWALPGLLIVNLALMAGCSSKPATVRYAHAGSNCHATAVPTLGEGGLAWANSLSAAQVKAMESCKRYASRSGGTPGTCHVVLAKCK